jgi:hypothetical protein
MLTASTAENVLVPSLLRHFASKPAALALMWVAALPALGKGIEKQALATSERARSLAKRLPYPIDRASDATTRSAVVRFSDAVATMIVAGDLLNATLSGQAGHETQRE